MKIQTMNINGQTGIIIESDQEPSSVVCFGIDNNQHSTDICHSKSRKIKVSREVLRVLGRVG